MIYENIALFINSTKIEPSIIRYREPLITVILIEIQIIKLFSFIKSLHEKKIKRDSFINITQFYFFEERSSSVKRRLLEIPIKF